jgi:flagellar biosynthetic protein FlhB
MEQDERTLAPTERRRRQAREQGRGPRSHDLSLACRMLGVAAGLQFCGSKMILGLAELMTVAFQTPIMMRPSIDSVTALILNSVMSVALNLAGLFAWIVGAGLVGRLVQVGFRLDFAEVNFDAHRMNPLDGLGKIFRPRNTLLSLGNFVKFTALISVGGWYFWSQLEQLLALPDEEIASSCVVIGKMVLNLAWFLAVVQLIAGCVDYGWQYWKFEQSLRMTPEELRSER